MIRRRTVLQRLMYAAGITVASTLPYGFVRLATPEARAEDPGTHLRPPGALKDDDAFNRACIGCGLCGEICPPRCIQFYQHEGGDKFNTPYIDPEQKACILCNKCMEVCPTEALVETPREEVDMGIAQIDRSACYPWVDRGICGACVSICPLGARAIDFKYWNQYKPVVKTDCVGCGLCVEVCPHPSLPIRIVERSKGTMVHHRL